MITLPRLELADRSSPFDEAVITIDGREEDQIVISCEGSLELADRLIRYVNNHALVLETLTAAAVALREFGAPKTAEYLDTLSKQLGEAA